MAILALMVFPAAVTAQTPRLALSAPSQGPNSGWRITLTNEYSAPVTAYALDVRAGATAARPGLLLGRTLVDSVPGPAQDRIRLGPRQSLTVRFGGASWQAPVFVNSAVIYADGAHTGKAALIAHLIAARHEEEADIRQVLPLLASAESDPQIDRDLPSLIQRFAARATKHSAALRDGVMRHSPDRICLSVVETLKNETRKETPEQALEALHIMFTRWLNQLRTSKPPLGTASKP